MSEKWTIEQQPWGTYIALDRELSEEEQETAKKRIVESIVKGLIERNLVQFISKDRDERFPIAEYKTLAAKLYVVPWEQMPHKRTIELRKYVENTLEEGKA